MMAMPHCPSSGRVRVSVIEHPSTVNSYILLDLHSIKHCSAYTHSAKNVNLRVDLHPMSSWWHCGSHPVYSNPAWHNPCRLGQCTRTIPLSRLVSLGASTKSRLRFKASISLRTAVQPACLLPSPMLHLLTMQFMNSLFILLWSLFCFFH